MFYRNTALNALWEDCYFMPSERSEEDEKINTFIITNLEKAAILDTSLPFPKEDYLYICQLHNTQPIDISTLPELSGKYPIGYRKGVITYKIGNLSFDLPGKNLYTLDGNTCVFYDNDRENWHVTRATAYSQPDHYFEFVKSDDEFICEGDFENGKYKLYFGGQNKEEDDDVYYTCLCQAITEDQYSIFTISAVTEVEAKSYIQTLADSLMAYRKR